jgi:ABC-2 type transport system permease protein
MKIPFHMRVYLEVDMELIRKVLAVTIKELLVIFTGDRGTLIGLFVLPLAISILSGAVFGGEASSIHIPVAVVNQDAGDYGDMIVEVLKDIKELSLDFQSAPAQAEDKVALGDFMAAVIIPPDFSQNIDDYASTEITVTIDPAQAQYGRIVTTIIEEISGALAIQGEIRYGIREVLADMGLDETLNPDVFRASQAQTEGVIFTQMQHLQTDEPIQLQRVDVKGEDVFSWEDNLFALTLPGLTVLFAFFVIPSLATELIKEKELGSLRRLVASPLPRGALIGGKVLAYTLMVLIQVVLVFGIVAVFFDMPLGSSPLGLLAVTIALGLSATTLGMLVSALARSRDQATSIGMLLIFVLGILAGNFNPDTAPFRGEGFMAKVSFYTPQAQSMIAYHTLMITHGTLVDVLPYVGYLLVLSLGFFLIAIWRFRFE